LWRFPEFVDHVSLGGNLSDQQRHHVHVAKFGSKMKWRVSASLKKKMHSFGKNTGETAVSNCIVFMDAFSRLKPATISGGFLKYRYHSPGFSTLHLRDFQ
jgi:hypothetical protein